MIYLLETELPKNDLLFLGLKKILGLGKYQSILLCRKLGASADLKVKDLSINQINLLRSMVKNSGLILGSDLKQLSIMMLKRKISIRLIKGIRNSKGLPVRGQRTHTNAKTAKYKLSVLKT